MNGPLVTTLFTRPKARPARVRVDPLFAANGALAEALFPALLADGQGRIRQGNAAGNALLARLDTKAAANLATKISAAIDTNAAQQLEFSPSENKEAALDLFLLPFPEENLVLLLAHDVTLDRNLREALIESRQRYKTLVETASDFVWETAPDGRFCFVSSKGVLGFDADALLGRDPESLLFDASETELVLPFRTTRAMEEVELWFRDAEGKAACLSLSAQPLFDAAGAWNGARGTCRDITEMRLHQMELAQFQNRERLLLFLTRTIRDEVEPEAMLARAATAIARAAGAEGCRIVALNDTGAPGLRAEFGALPAFDAEEAALQNSETVFPIHFENPEAGLLAATSYRQQRNGLVSLWRKSPPFGKDERDLLTSVAGQLGIALEQIAVHRRLLHLSTTDALTGLLNRRAFHDKLDRRFARAAKGREKAALFYLDLDNFKQTNDRRGHAAGDAALRKVGKILGQNTRSADLVARHGGDEFALWLENTNATAAGEKARAILNAAAALAEFSGGANCPLGFSIGIAVFDPDHGETLADLLGRADAAMYQAKQAGKGDWRLAGTPKGTPR